MPEESSKEKYVFIRSNGETKLTETEHGNTVQDGVSKQDRNGENNIVSTN